MLLQLPVLGPTTISHRLSRVQFSAGRSPHRRLPLKLLSSLGGDRWKKLVGLDPELVQERLSSWLLKAQTLITEVAAPLVKPGQGNKIAIEHELEDIAIKEEVFMASELTVDRKTPNGYLSFAAVVSIEQFGRMNGLTGRKMQKIFKSLAPDPVRNDARSLVEYCCFRYLSRDSSDFHPSLKELAFQRLIFITMLAWVNPYSGDGDSHMSLENSCLQMKLVGEEAFVRIAPAVAGVADISTAHHLYNVCQQCCKTIFKKGSYNFKNRWLNKNKEKRVEEEHVWRCFNCNKFGHMKAECPFHKSTTSKKKKAIKASWDNSDDD